MSIKRTIIVTVAIVASVAMVAPTFAGATTVSDLMAQINALQAQLNSLSGTSTATGTGACAGVSFTRNLTVGSTGSDVKCLQSILNQSASTQVATTGAGAPGFETSTFGPKTLVAVKKYQVANGFTPANQVGPMTRAKLNAALGTVTTTTTGGQTTVVTSTGPVSALLASSTPAAGALICGQATARLLDINFVGNGTVTSVTLQRTGISDQNTLANVYLYDGNTRITDGYSFNVSGQLVMNGLSIAANGSHVITVKADLQGTGCTSTSSSITVALTSYIANGTTSSANVQGNAQSIVTGSAASAVLSANTYASATPSVNAGTTQYTMWSAPLQINTRAVLLKTASFKMIGSAPTNALANIKLFVDGVDTGKTASVAAVNGSNYAMFDLTSAPITLTTGSHTIDVRSDIVAGAYRTIQLSLQQAADLTITDPQVGVNVAAVGPTSSATTFATNSGATVSIATGSSTAVVESTFNAQTNISGGATNAIIARYTLHSYGEDVKVTSLAVTPAVTNACTTGSTYSGSAVASATTTSVGTATGACATDLGYAYGNGLNNVTLYFNGSQIGSSQNWTYALQRAATPLTFQLGSQLIIPAGTDATLEVRADLQTAGNSSYSAGTVTVTIDSGASKNAQGQSSQNTVFVPGNTAQGTVATNGLAIQSGNLQVASNTSYLNQSVIPNAQNVKIGSYIVQNQSTSEAVRLTSLLVKILTTGGATLSTTPAITNFSALRTSDTTGNGSTPIQPTGADTFTVNDTLAPGASMTIDIFANTGSDSSSSFLTKLTVASIGAVDNIAAAGTQTTGQTITLGNGSVAVPTIVASSTTPIEFVASPVPGGASNAAQATFNFVSTSGASTISELKFAVYDTSSLQNSITRICVGSVCAQPVSGTADLTGLSLAVPNGGGGLTQNVSVSYSGVGTGGLAPSTFSNIGLTYVKSTSGGTTRTLCITGQTCTSASLGSEGVLAFGSSSGAGIILTGSVPAVSVNSTPVSGLTYAGATQKIGEVTVTAGTTGNIKVNQIVFSMGYSGFSTENLGTPYLVNGASGSTAISTFTCTATGSSNLYSQVTCVTNSSSPSTYANDWTVTAGQPQIFSLYAPVTGTLVSNGTTWGVSSSLTASGFKWDDTSTNGSTGTGIAGTNIYGFPAGSYSVHN